MQNLYRIPLNYNFIYVLCSFLANEVSTHLQQSWVQYYSWISCFCFLFHCCFLVLYQVKLYKHIKDHRQRSWQPRAESQLSAGANLALVWSSQRQGTKISGCPSLGLSQGQASRERSVGMTNWSPPSLSCRRRWGTQRKSRSTLEVVQK